MRSLALSEGHTLCLKECLLPCMHDVSLSSKLICFFSAGPMICVIVSRSQQLHREVEMLWIGCGFSQLDAAATHYEHRAAVPLRQGRIHVRSRKAMHYTCRQMPGSSAGRTVEMPCIIHQPRPTSPVRTACNHSPLRDIAIRQPRQPLPCQPTISHKHLYMRGNANPNTTGR